MNVLRDKLYSLGNPSTFFIFCGDFNMPGVNWDADFMSGGRGEDFRQ